MPMPPQPTEFLELDLVEAEIKRTYLAFLLPAKAFHMSEEHPQTPPQDEPIPVPPPEPPPSPEQPPPQPPE